MLDLSTFSYVMRALLVMASISVVAWVTLMICSLYAVGVIALF